MGAVRATLVHFSILLAVLVPSLAWADVIVFLNLNDSKNEIEAAERAARRRGDKLVIYPRVTEEGRRKIDSLTNDLRKIEKSYTSQCLNSDTPKCNEMRATRRNLKSELRKIRPQYSQDEFRKTLRELSANGEKVNSMVISGHDGSGSFSGVFGATNDVELGKLLSEFPDHRDSMRSLHLWGCYTATVGSVDFNWKKNFPNVALISGYNGIAPADDKPAGYQYLEGVLSKEKALIEAGDLNELRRLFKSIENVSNVTAAICADDFYVSNSEAFSRSERHAMCAEQLPLIKEKMVSFECYYKATSDECADPPTNTQQGPLRELYNLLQANRHCAEDPTLGHEFKSFPTVDQLIRIMYTKNLRKNFADHYGKEIRETNEILSELEIPMSFEDLENMSRADLIKSLDHLKRYIEEKDKIFGNKKEFAEQAAKLEALRGFWNAANSLIINGNPSCVPFSWVEPGSSEASCVESSSMGRARVTHALQNPADSSKKGYSSQLNRLNSRRNELIGSQGRLSPQERSEINLIDLRSERLRTQDRLQRDRERMVELESELASATSDNERQQILIELEWLRDRTATAERTIRRTDLNIERTQLIAQIDQRGQPLPEQRRSLERLDLEMNLLQAEQRAQNARHVGELLESQMRLVTDETRDSYEETLRENRLILEATEGHAAAIRAYLEVSGLERRSESEDRPVSQRALAEARARLTQSTRRVAESEYERQLNALDLRIREITATGANGNPPSWERDASNTELQRLTTERRNFVANRERFILDQIRRVEASLTSPSGQ